MNRRSFLRSTAVFGSGLILASPGIARAQKSGGEEINVAVIGVGAQGQALLRSCVKIPGVRIKAICDIWEDFHQKKASELLAKHRQEPKAYVDCRELLSDEKNLDAAIIATPDFVHADHTVRCLKSGLHVYCEKPMSNTLEGARKMVETARQTGKLLQIGHQRRSNPRYIHCSEALLGEIKLLGTITTASAQWNRSVEPDRGWPRRYPLAQSTLERYGYQSMHHFRNWRWYHDLGSGPVGECGSDQIDVLSWFLSARPSAVLASGGTDYLDPKTHEWPDNMFGIYEYKTARGTVRASYQTTSTNGNDGHLEKLLGDQGTLVLSEGGAAYVLREPAAPDWEKWAGLDLLRLPGKPQSEGAGDSSHLEVSETKKPTAFELPVTLNQPPHMPHLENFFDAVRGRASLNCPAAVGYRAIVSVLKTNEAVVAGRRLHFTEEEFAI